MPDVPEQTAQTKAELVRTVVACVTLLCTLTLLAIEIL